MHASLGPAEPKSQTVRHLVRSGRCCTADVRQSLYFTIGRPFTRSKLPRRMGGSGRHLIHGSFGPPESTSQTTSRSVQPFCRAHDRDRPTDRPRYSVCSNRDRIYVYVVLRCSIKYIISCCITFSLCCILIVTSRVSRRRRKMYCGHARLCVCLFVRGRTPTLLHGPGCNLGSW